MLNTMKIISPPPEDVSYVNLAAVNCRSWDCFWRFSWFLATSQTGRRILSL